MRVLIVNRFFGGAQIPTGRMAEDVARVLVAAGHEVTALASSGEYVGAACRADVIRHTSSGIRLEEVLVPKWMPRAFAWLWFTWQARRRIPKMDWDVCVLMTDPPLLPLLAARLKDKGTKRPKADRSETTRGAAAGKPKATRRLAVWLMDLYPEALAASGRITRRNPLYKWYFEKRQRALGSADLLICLGQSQKELVETGSTRPTRIAVVPPWDDRGNIALATEYSLKNLALYAGNLGEAHCFEEILAAAPHLPGDWTIRFAARGAKLEALREKAKGISHRLTRIDTDMSDRHAPTGLGGNAHAGGPPAFAVSPPSEEIMSQGSKVEITGYASEAETPGLLASARVHLITMSPGWDGIVVPSKLYGCIRTGRPVLFIGPENADTAREIRANDWGKVLPPGASGEEVAAAILELAARPTTAPQLQQRAAEIAALLVATAGLQDNGTTGPRHQGPRTTG